MWIVGWLLCTAIATPYPFEFAVAETHSGWRLLGRSLRLPDIADIGFNVLLFAPIGTLLSALGGPLHEDRRATLAIAALLRFTISRGIEHPQGYLPLRVSSVVDIASNTAGALAGAWGAQALAPRAPRLRRWASPDLVTAWVADALIRRQPGRAMIRLALVMPGGSGMAALRRKRRARFQLGVEFKHVVHHAALVSRDHGAS